MVRENSAFGMQEFLPKLSAILVRTLKILRYPYPRPKEFNLYSGKANKYDNTEKSFIEIFEEYTTKQGAINSWSGSIYKKFNSLKNHILNFDKNISFDVVNEDFMIGFISYLQSNRAMKLNYKDAEIGMRNTTISRTIVFFKMFLRWSKKHGYYNGDVHENFKPKFI